MGAEQCVCTRNQSSSMLYNAPEKQDACRMFSHKNSSMELDWSADNLVKKTVYRGFTDDPNVKIRFIAENKKTMQAVP